MDDRTATQAPPEAEQPPKPAPLTQSSPPRWTAGRIAMITVGGVLALVALAVIACGAYGLWLHTTQRSDGYVMTSAERFATGSYALATRTLDISSDVPSFLYGRDWLGDVRIRGESTDPARPLFIGIAHKSDVDRYLAGVAHSDVVDVSGDPFGTIYRPTYDARPGGKPATPPNRASFWAASVEGQGIQTLTWSVKHGRWSVVVMRPDGSRQVAAKLAAGAKLPALLWVSIALALFGLLVLVTATALIHFAARHQTAPAQPAASASIIPKEQRPSEPH
jgi:hypothetical protein